MFRVVAFYVSVSVFLFFFSFIFFILLLACSGSLVPLFAIVV